MTANEILSLLPLIIVAASSVVLVGVAAFFRNRTLLASLTSLVLIVAIASIWLAGRTAPLHVAKLFWVDSYALYFLGLILLSSLIAVIFAALYPVGEPKAQAELFPLMLISTLGAGAVVLSDHFLSFFLGLETLSVSAYVLIAYFRRGSDFEASLKYLVMASVASAFLLFGIALIYFQTGTMSLDPASGFPRILEDNPGLYLVAGLAMVMVGIGFKIAVVPFHMWAPDVYQGASPPVAGFIATVSKGAVFAFALRYFAVASRHEYGTLTLAVSIIAIVSMFVGNWLALLQNNVKRILGYSSISHAGYVLVAFQASGALAVQAVGYYLAAYFASILGAFGVLTMLAHEGSESESFDELEGLAWRQPLLAVIFTLMLFSLAGIPLTAGFLGEFYVLSAAVRSSLWPLAISFIISAVIGLFYYLRVIVALYRHPEKDRAREADTSYAGAFILGLLALLVLFLGTYPSPLADLLSSALLP